MDSVGKGSVRGVNADRAFRSLHPAVCVTGEARNIAAAFLAGHGTRGERLYDGTYQPHADPNAPIPGLRIGGMLVRRNIFDGGRGMPLGMASCRRCDRVAATAPSVQAMTQAGGLHDVIAQRCRLGGVYALSPLTA